MSPAARAIVNDIVGRAERDVRVAVPRAVAQEMQHIGPSRQIELENEGELTTYLDGSRRLVLITPIYARLIRLALASHPLDGADDVLEQVGVVVRALPLNDRGEPLQARAGVDGGLGQRGEAAGWERGPDRDQPVRWSTSRFGGGPGTANRAGGA